MYESWPAQSTGDLPDRGSRGIVSRLRAAKAWGLGLAARVWSAPLEWRFLFFSVVVLVTGALIIGGWTSGEIKERVIQRSAATNALYVDSFVGPLLEPLEQGSTLPPENVAALEGLLAGTALGDRIVSFKI